MKIKGISASSYNSYEWCPWQFYLTQVLGFEDESGPAATMGHMAHKIFEILSRLSLLKHDKNSKYWKIEYLWRICFDHYYRLRPEQCEKIENTKLNTLCKGIINLLNSEYTPIRDNIICVEKRFSIPIQEKEFIIPSDKGELQYLCLRGVIDRVDKINDNTVEVTDYKTGTRTNFETKDRKKKDSKSLYEEIQPRLYHLATKQLFPWATNVLVTFNYIADGGPVTIPFADIDIPETANRLKRKLRVIKLDEDPQRNITWKCKICSFSRNGVCDSVFQEKNELGFEFITSKYRLLNYRETKKPK